MNTNKPERNRIYLDYCGCLELAGKCAARGFLAKDVGHLINVADSLMRHPEEQRLLKRLLVKQDA